jgi:protein-disulfide isomerase
MMKTRLVSAVLLALVVGCSKSEEPVKADQASASARDSGSASAPVAATAKAPPVAPTPSAAPIDAGALLAFFPDAGFTPRETNDLATALSSLDAPCPSVAVSLATCLTEHRACDACGPAARYVAIGVRGGWPPEYTRLAYASRFDPAKVIDLPVDGSPTKGPEKAPVSIVEFGSYLCPHCAAEAPKLDALLKAHPKDVRLVFKPAWSPTNAIQEKVTRAAIAAGAQGKFWEMHAALFANQPKFTDADLDGYAKGIGIDPAKLKTDMASPATTERLMKDLAALKTAHVDSLPTILINGHPYFSFEDLESRIAFELDAAKTKK